MMVLAYKEPYSPRVARALPTGMRCLGDTMAPFVFVTKGNARRSRFKASPPRRLNSPSTPLPPTPNMFAAFTTPISSRFQALACPSLWRLLLVGAPLRYPQRCPTGVADLRGLSCPPQDDRPDGRPWGGSHTLARKNGWCWECLGAQLAAHYHA